MTNRILCKICDRSYERLDMHLKEKHNTDLGYYLKEFYITKDEIPGAHYDLKDVRRNICLKCNKKVIWLQDHIIQEHKMSFLDYLKEYLLDYKSFLSTAKNKIYKHHLLKVWDCFGFYSTRVDKMVNSLAYKKSLNDTIKEELHGKALEMFHRFHFEYDPEFKTVNPDFLKGKTPDYYEKYMFMKLRRQLWYFVQKYYIDIKRETCMGGSADLEFYNSYMISDEEAVSTNELWDIIRQRLKTKQVVVLDLFLQGFSQKEISEKLSLTQSWVSSIKTSILEVIQGIIDEDSDFEDALRDYYHDLTEGAKR